MTASHLAGGDFIQGGGAGPLLSPHWRRHWFKIFLHLAIALFIPNIIARKWRCHRKTTKIGSFGAHFSGEGAPNSGCSLSSLAHFQTWAKFNLGLLTFGDPRMGARRIFFRGGQWGGSEGRKFPSGVQGQFRGKTPGVSRRSSQKLTTFTRNNA